MEEREREWQEAISGSAAEEGGWGLARRAATAIFIGGAAVLFFRWVFPLALPVFLGWVISLLLRPVVRFFRRYYHFPNGLAMAAALLLALAASGAFVYGLGSLFGSQLIRLMEQMPAILGKLQALAESFCAGIEGRLGLEGGSLMSWLTEQTQEMTESFSDRIMENSSAYLTAFFSWGANLAFVILFSVLWLKEGEKVQEKIRCRVESMTWGGRIRRVASSMRKVCLSWLGCEGKILLSTCVLCVLGLWLIGNPYALVLGLVIGLLDALPLFGTGTVLIPWAVFSLLMKNWLQGGVLLGIYLVCYFIREVWEARCFSKRLGGSDLESVAAMFAGWKLAGVAGLILGPVVWIFVREILKVGFDAGNS